MNLTIIAIVHIAVWVFVAVFVTFMEITIKQVPYQQCSELFNPSNSPENLDTYNHCLSYPQTYNITQYTIYEEWIGANK